LEALVNGVLCAQVIDSVPAETKIGDGVPYELSRFWQVEHLSAKGSRILTHHKFHSADSPPQFQQTDPEKPRAHQNLQQTQGGSICTAFRAVRTPIFSASFF
jgi:hypothetical protein